jgi:hypothetical protein
MLSLVPVAIKNSSGQKNEGDSVGSARKKGRGSSLRIGKRGMWQKIDLENLLSLVPHKNSSGQKNEGDSVGSARKKGRGNSLRIGKREMW